MMILASIMFNPANIIISSLTAWPCHGVIVSIEVISAVTVMESPF